MSLVDYSKYTTDELFDVKENISLTSPNYPLLLIELANREKEITATQETMDKRAIELANKVNQVGGKRSAVKLWMYTGACLYLPPIIFSKGQVLYGTIVIVIAILLYKFDPTFKIFKEGLPRYNDYFIISFSSGVLLAISSQFFEVHSGWLMIPWLFSSYIYGYILAQEIDGTVE
ncbi:hypothetical protein [Colwellia sp. 12G3]|uniref:hypothetical protein n=1 Tax=Colwellia sp. 12G3 TaxID=2058299 RepID=UPI000C33EDFC|nr:hypothetical protein [Colwellia sp. 12G3]PKI15939.1 hypothetical protein CXF71_11605 [Colwellia sp. 12G3]